MKPTLPAGYRWLSVETHRVIFQHIASCRSYGVRSFARDGLTSDSVAKEIAYGVAKIERELQRDAAHLESNQD